MSGRIANADALARTPLRRDALSIVEAAYAAIDTDAVVRRKLRCEGDTLIVDGAPYDLASFERVRLLGFGKASCRAIQTVEEILRERLSDGAAIDVRGAVCGVVDVAQGTHPRPSPGNVAASGRIVKIAEDSGERDLVIVVVSGGGSSLLCWPMDECDQGARLYEDAARAGLTIGETNLVRRHISEVKGGGLAAMLYPATVIGLVFCDVPGDGFSDVASGPTYFDPTAAADAGALLARHGLSGYDLRETPKEEKIFEKVRNVPMISNTDALAAMRQEAQRLGYAVKDLGEAHYEEPAPLAALILDALEENVAVVAGGETRLEVSRAGGKGGRCQYLALEALKRLGPDDLFLPFASDGIDNCDAAGVIADAQTFASAQEQNLSIDERLASFDTYDFFEKTHSLVMTGVTEANVSDLYLALRKKAR